MSKEYHSLRFCEAAAAVTDLWLSLPRRENQVCPDKTNFSPATLRKHLSSVVLYERTVEGEIKVRVAGTSIREFLGQEITGANLLDIFPPEFARAYHAYYENLTEHPCAGVVERPVRGAGGVAYLVKTLQLPLLNSKGEAKFFLGTSKSYPLPKHFTDYRSAAMTASRNLDITYVDIGAGSPDHTETTMARGISA
jgi:hypothetical protein